MLALLLAVQAVPTGVDWNQLGPLGGLLGLAVGTLVWAWRRDVARADRYEHRLWELEAEMRELLRANARVETAASAATKVRSR